VPALPTVVAGPTATGPAGEAYTSCTTDPAGTGAAVGAEPSMLHGIVTGAAAAAVSTPIARAALAIVVVTPTAATARHLPRIPMVAPSSSGPAAAGVP